MKRLKNHGVLAAGLILALAVGNSAMASQSILQGGDSGPRLEGAWLVTVTGEDGSSFLSLRTYMEGGGAIGSNSRGPSGSSPSHGNWVTIGRGRFTATSVAFRFNEAGQLIGTNRITQNILLVGPDEFRTVNFIQLFDADEKLIGTGRDTSVGRRLEIVDFSEQP